MPRRGARRPDLGGGGSGWRVARDGVMLDGVAGQLERYMDLLSARQKLVASNIANADTPGYRTQDLNFHEEFQNATNSAPRVVEVAGLPVKNDGNSVSL